MLRKHYWNSQICDLHAKITIETGLYATEQLYNKFNAHLISKAFGIPQGTFSNHVLRNKKDNMRYAKHHEELRLRIQETYDESNQIFGATKLRLIWKAKNSKSAMKWCACLCMDMGLVSIRQSARKLYESEGHEYKNHLNQKFDTHESNEVWISDATYFEHGENAYYICVISTCSHAWLWVIKQKKPTTRTPFREHTCRMTIL